MVASISARGTGAFSVSAAASLGALANANGTAGLQVSATLVSYAIGHMAGTTAVVDDLTPASIALSVRNELATELARLLDLAKIHGLISGTPLVVTSASRLAGDVEQTVGESAGTVTVTRV